MVGECIEAKRCGQRETGEVHVVFHGSPHNLNASGIASGRPRFELADISSPKSRLSNSGQALYQVGNLDCQPQAPLDNHCISMRRACLGHKRKRVPDESLADSLRIESRRCDATGSLPQCVKWKPQRPFELLGTDWEQERENGIAQQPGFHQIRARDSEVCERGLE